MEKLLYFALIMLKRMSPSEASDPPICTSTTAAGTSTQPPVTEPAATTPQPTDQDVATEPSEAKLEAPVATPSKAKTSSKKKTKKNK